MNLLVTKAKKHDKDAFSKLIEQQEKAMYQMAKSILRNEEDVADAIQETIMICYVFDDLDAMIKVSEKGMDCDAVKQAVVNTEVEYR